MKIISQSTVAHRPPYFHLAYLAASHTAPSGGLFGAGMLALLLGCVLSFRFARREATGKPPGPITLGLRRHNPKALFWGLVCLVIGPTIVFLSFKAGETRYARPGHLTQIRMDVLSSHIERHLVEGEPIPENIASLATQWELPKSSILDGWSNEMRLTRATEEGWAGCAIFSAGKDEEFDTGDDLLQAIPYRQKEPEVKI